MPHQSAKRKETHFTSFRFVCLLDIQSEIKDEYVSSSLQVAQL